jgi:hypothetical protein
MEIVIGRNNKTRGKLQRLINKHGGSLEIAGIQYGDALCLNGRNGFDLMGEQYRFDKGFEVKAIEKVLSWLKALNK